MRRLIQFLTHQDAAPARAVLICLGLFAGVAAIYAAGKMGLGVGDELTLERWFEGVADSRWALPATVLAFVALAFLGAPQFLLFAAAVVAFGPRTGAAYSWVGTMVAAGITFWLGRVSGAEIARRYGGDAVARFSRFVGRNGFWTALAIRNVPSAPFIVVNMGLGMSHSRFSHFMAGTAIGIIPKIALVAFAGKGLMELFLRAASWEAAALAAIGAALWLVFMLFSRRFLKRREGAAGAGQEAPGPADGP
jgi:uncharacterized membrane protein YdjX (TVP38/TMEM64 family)